MDNDTVMLMSTSRTSTTGLQHHFENQEQQKDASTIGMWTFLLTEIMFFGGLFLAYFIYRQWYPVAFAAASLNTNLWMGGQRPPF